MEPIRETIQEVLGKWKAQKKAAAARNFKPLLRKMFSNNELKHVRFGSLKKGVLNIKVDSSSWLYQLTLHKKDLLSKAMVFSGEIKDIRFRIGDMAAKDNG